MIYLESLKQKVFLNIRQINLLKLIAIQNGISMHRGQDKRKFPHLKKRGNGFIYCNGLVYLGYTTARAGSQTSKTNPSRARTELGNAAFTSASNLSKNSSL
jgi:hypothetical protein